MNDIEVVFLDMDNTIAENRTSRDICYYKGMYIEKRPIQIMIEAIKEFYIDRGIPVIVLSKTKGGIDGKREKVDWLNACVDYDLAGIILIEDQRKVNIIREWCLDNKVKLNRVLIIDDNKQTLQECCDAGIYAKYPQQLICDYEEIHNINRR